MYLVLGDWSGDGHEKSDKILVETNHPVGDVQQAYKDSCKLTTVEFNCNQSYTGVERDWRDRDKYGVCVNYEDCGMTKEVFDILSKYDGFSDFGLDQENEYCIDEDTFIALWFWFAKLSLPDLEYKRIMVKDDIPVINGYWNDNLNVQFGYGLYY